MIKVYIIPVMISVFLLLVDLYVYQGYKVLFSGQTPLVQRNLKIVYWAVTLLSLILVWLSGGRTDDKRNLSTIARSVIMVQYVPKFLSLIFLLLDDLIRLIRWISGFFSKTAQEVIEKTGGVPRSEFLMTAGAVTAATLIGGFTFGILKGAHDYRIRRRTIVLKNLPKAFHGFKIVQLSDIHSGSFWNKRAVIGGVEMVMAEKPEVILFTGDLVNDTAGEMRDYQPVFEKLSAPLGVYSVLGNHDYGDYVPWNSIEQKAQNLRDLATVQKNMGWDLLINEHRTLKVDNEMLDIVGIENWGAKGRFPKYGKMDVAMKGTQDDVPKILLSHDPSHWRAQVLKEYPQIGLMLAGHTHGMQFGVEIPGVKWSPVQYMYPEWADLYQEGDQQLYVNRGFGYIGFPGRLGITPEITVIELAAG
jgi:predicted MPP superfamily phosphohydrolase